MGQNKFDLPLEYKKMPEYFDAHNIGDDTDAKNAVVEKLLSKHKAKTVLDLTCGTGSQVFFLNKRGYDVTGSDFSPALLDIARKNAAAGKVSVKFIDGDMRTLKIGRFDAAITMFNAIGHLSKAGFEKAVRNIHKNLNRDGIYIFDIMNLTVISENSIDSLAMDFTKTIGDTKIRNVQYSTIDSEKGRLTSYDAYTIQEGSNQPKKLKHNFTLQIYTADELKDILARNRFETLEQYAIDGSKFVETKSENILTVAKKLD